jgi:DNA-binding response OmpR family regulator
MISRDQGTPAVDLASLVLPLDALDGLPEDTATRLLALPVRHDQGHLFVAMADPNDPAAIAEIGFVTGKKIIAYAALKGQLVSAIKEVYASLRAGDRVWRGPRAPSDEPASDLSSAIARERASTPPPVREPFTGESTYGGPRATPPPVRTRPRVLVVDDEPAIRRMLRQSLAQRGWEVIDAEGGVEAFRHIKVKEPDAILLDAMLPDVHGFEICKRLKSSQRYAHIPIVMMTAVYKGWRIAADLKESYGVAATIEKPFEIQNLVRIVEAALSGRVAAVERAAAHALSQEAQRLYTEGADAYRRRDYDAAMVSMNAAVAIDPLSASLHHQIGLLHAACGRDFGAIQSLETAVDLEPGRFQTLRNLAVLYQRHGFRRKSCEFWERALAQSPDDATRAEIKQVLVALL